MPSSLYEPYQSGNFFPGFRALIGVYRATWYTRIRRRPQALKRRAVFNPEAPGLGRGGKAQNHPQKNLKNRLYSRLKYHRTNDNPDQGGAGAASFTFEKVCRVAEGNRQNTGYRCNLTGGA
jgi:hypothetical protein